METLHPESGFYKLGDDNMGSHCYVTEDIGGVVYVFFRGDDWGRKLGNPKFMDHYTVGMVDRYECWCGCPVRWVQDKRLGTLVPAHDDLCWGCI